MNRTQSILISLWLFLSCPFNIVTLKILIRDICWMVFQLAKAVAAVSTWD